MKTLAYFGHRLLLIVFEVNFWFMGVCCIYFLAGLWLSNSIMQTPVVDISCESKRKHTAVNHPPKSETMRFGEFLEPKFWPEFYKRRQESPSVRFSAGEAEPNSLFMLIQSSGANSPQFSLFILTTVQVMCLILTYKLNMPSLWGIHQWEFGIACILVIGLVSWLQYSIWALKASQFRFSCKNVFAILMTQVL